MLSTFVISGNTNHGDDNQNRSSTSANNEDDLYTGICRTVIFSVDCSPGRKAQQETHTSEKSE